MENIRKIIKKINIENLLCFFLILTPILDITSFLFRNAYNTNFSLSTFIRPVIPAIIVIFILKKRKDRLKIISICILYALYGIGHLLIYKNNIMGCTYGTVLQEARYIANYTFMILILFEYCVTFYKKENNKLNNTIIIANAIYIVSIYIAILSGTSSSSYIEGIGYKGWFESANSVGSILIFLTTIILSQMEKYTNVKQKICSTILVLLNGIYLTTLIGTRVGLIGFVLLIITYIIIYATCRILKKSRIDKKVVGIFGIIIIGIIIAIVCLGSNTINRRKQIEKLGQEVIDESTNQQSHLTGDLTNIYLKIENKTLPDGFMSQAQKNSVIDLYKWANEHDLKNTDTRMQQLVYNILLVKNQKNIEFILLGNGYLSNTNELVLEMELPSFALNFGIIGAILYLGGFIFIFIYAIIVAIKNIKKIDVEMCMLLVGNGLAYILSALAGYTFFNPSSMLMIVIMNVLLINKTMILRGEKN